jgi:hypothetical protein
MAIKKRPAKPKVSDKLRGVDLDLFNRAPAQQSIASPTVKVTIDLEKLFADAVANDADEIVVRIAQYTPELDPASYQAIVRFSDRTRAWACVAHKDPHIAFVDAMLQAGKMPRPTMKKRMEKHVKPSQDTTGILRVGSDSGIKRVKGRIRKGT